MIMPIWSDHFKEKPKRYCSNKSLRETYTAHVGIFVPLKDSRWLGLGLKMYHFLDECRLLVHKYKKNKRIILSPDYFEFFLTRKITLERSTLFHFQFDFAPSLRLQWVSFAQSSALWQHVEALALLSRPLRRLVPAYSLGFVLQFLVSLRILYSAPAAVHLPIVNFLFGRIITRCPKISCTLTLLLLLAPDRHDFLLPNCILLCSTTFLLPNCIILSVQLEVLIELTLIDV